jgi:transcriptional regulator with XRE-family HTH domain
MKHHEEARAFLTSRRAKITPDQVGLPVGYGRRVPGLRRSEVAFLANVSVEYYAQLERGGLAGVSDSVVDAVARALRLDDAERTYLFHLAATANRAPAPRPLHRTHVGWEPREGLRRTLDAIDAPAFVRNGRLDIVTANRLGYALYSTLFDNPDNRGNLARFIFCDRERAARFYLDWDDAADATATVLRIETGRDPDDKERHLLIEELTERSEAFRTRWESRDVRFHGNGAKTIGHAVGELELRFESLEVTSEPGLAVVVYTAEAASSSAERLRMLEDWADELDHRPAVARKVG